MTPTLRAAQAARRLGAVWGALIVGLAGMVVSGVLSYAFFMATNPEALDHPAVLALPVIVPALVAPPVAYLLIRLIIALAEEQHSLRAEMERRTEAEARLRELAIRDDLTGLFNRRHFQELVAQISKTARRFGHPLSVALFDIDHFKQVNDTFGHDVGDRALRHIARIGEANLREVDILARYGGEEFALLYPVSDLDMAHSVSERLRAALEKTPFEVEGRAVPLTASFGVATLKPGDTDLEGLIKRADGALYAAKAAGRNQVVVETALTGAQA